MCYSYEAIIRGIGVNRLIRMDLFIELFMKVLKFHHF